MTFFFSWNTGILGHGRNLLDFEQVKALVA